MNKLIELKNKYILKAIPKTRAEAFKNLRVGDMIEIRLKLTHERSGDNNSLIAYYPSINGITTGIPTINKLIEKGMVLDEIIDGSEYKSYGEMKEEFGDVLERLLYNSNIQLLTRINEALEYLNRQYAEQDKFTRITYADLLYNLELILKGE